MGQTYVTVTVRNPAEPDRVWEGKFLADTGANMSVVPRKHLEAIGIEPVGTRVAELADGSLIHMRIGRAHLDFIGEHAAATVAFGSDDAEPLLGLLAMQDVGVKVDTVNHRLERTGKIRI